MLNANKRRYAACLLLLLFLCAAAQGLPVLEKPVTLHARSQPVEEILNEISRQAGIQFSYSPQVVDVRRAASLEAHNLPVREALRLVLGGGYEYKTVRRFIILRKPRVEIYPQPTPEPPPLSAGEMSYAYITNQRYVKKLYYTDSGATLDSCLIITNTKNSEVMKKYFTAIALAAAVSVSAQPQQPSAASGQLGKAGKELGKAGKELGKAGKELVALVVEVADSTAQAVKTAANEIVRQASSLKIAADTAPPTAAAPDTLPALTPPDTSAAAPQPAVPLGDSVHPIIFTMLYPFSFPELHTERYGYRTSLTWLCGVNGGVSGAELGCGVNVNLRYMSGAQLAGVANLSLGSVTGTQLAGMANLAGKGTAKAQLTGMANVAQRANLQAAGIANAAQHSAKVQLAGIANVADTSRCQVGLLNAARRAGVQVGLVNICDTSDGIMVGLVNVARRGGLYELEVSVALANQLNLAYRIGTKKFYTFAELSYQWDERLWLTGGGVGAQIALPKGWALNVEGLSQSVLSGRSWKNDGLNMLAQTRVAGSKQLAKHFAVFAGPTFSVYYTKPNKSGSIDLPVPYHLFRVNNSHIAAKAWVGFSVGVRIM
ncbi:MAG: STN domain-containing protein [Prevotellaceae bacterium]|jgi:hypothetical protein|nr:STN domain-containing protein [Prevotellaceae bacterium]